VLDALFLGFVLEGWFVGQGGPGDVAASRLLVDDFRDDLSAMKRPGEQFRKVVGKIVAQKNRDEDYAPRRCN
jgi:hypothetical protein